MRLNANHLSTTGKGGRIVLLASKILVAVVCAGHAEAQVSTAPAPGAPAAATDTTNPASSNNTQNQNLPDQNALNPNSADQSRALVPGISQNPLNPVPTNIPQYFAQPGNPISPYTSSSANPQSPQLTAPSLYLTGSNDLSLAGTSAALSQAFSEQGAGGFYSDPLMDYDHPPIERLRLGPFDLKAAVVTNVVADDNVRTSGGQSGGSGGGSKGDINYGVTPAILLQYGDHDGQKGAVTLVYSPTFTRFIHHSGENSDDYQNVALNAVYPFQRLTLNLTQTYTQTTGVNTNSTNRTTQTSSLSLIGASYDVDDKISVSSQLQEIINKFSAPSGEGTGGGGEGDTITTLNNTATYRLSEKMTVGPSLNLGIDKPDNSSQQTFEQALLGFNYAPTEKIGLYLQGGAQLSQYQHNGDSINPVFGTGIGYTPFDSTTINIGASQSIYTDTNITTTTDASMLNQTVVATNVNANIIQRIAQRVFLGFQFEYTHNDNQGGTGGSTAGSSSQDTFTYRPSVTFSPTGWSNLALYYQYLSNESGVPGSSYNDNQVGLSASVQF